MNYTFTKTVFISLLLHAVFFSLLIYYNRQDEEPFGQEFVSVEIIGDGASGDTSSPPLEKGGDPVIPPFVKGGQGGFNNGNASSANDVGRGAPPRHYTADGQVRAPAILGEDETPPLQTSPNEPNDSTLTSTLSHQGRGGIGPGSATGDPILAKIRSKIERSKYYPQQARLQRLEGRPEVSFKVAPNGAVESVKLARSSGNALLDSAAIETVNRAAPLPYYDGQISLAINFTLR